MESTSQIDFTLKSMSMSMSDKTIGLLRCTARLSQIVNEDAKG